MLEGLAHRFLLYEYMQTDFNIFSSIFDLEEEVTVECS